MKGKKLVSIIITSIIILNSVIGISAVEDKNKDDEKISALQASVIARITVENLNKENMQKADKIKLKRTDLYDFDENVEAYCFDYVKESGSKGYVVISAKNNRNLIIEYSDKANSIYYEKAAKNEKTIYNDIIEPYFKKEEKTILGLKKDIYTLPNGKKIEDKKLNKKRTLYTNASYKEKNKKLLDDTVNYLSTYSYTLNDNYQYIDDPYEYMNYHYGYNWVNVSYKTLEENMNFIGDFHAGFMYDNTKDATSHRIEGLYDMEHHALTAITNAMFSHRTTCCKKFGIAPDCYHDLFNTVFTVAKNNRWFWNLDSTSAGAEVPDENFYGVNPIDAPKIANAAFRSYGYNQSKCTYVNKPTWNTVVNEIQNDRPCVLHLNDSSGHYGKHSVVVFAWTTVRTNEYPYGDHHFVKIASGCKSDYDFSNREAQNRYIHYEYLLSKNYSMTKIIPF